MLTDPAGSSRVACRMQWSLPRGVQSGPMSRGTSPLALNTASMRSNPNGSHFDLLRPPRQARAEADRVLGVGQARRQLGVADLPVHGVEVARRARAAGRWPGCGSMIWRSDAMAGSRPSRRSVGSPNGPGTRTPR